MTRHNGKARNSGMKVGQALMAAHKKGGGGGGGGNAAGRHTTDIKSGPGIQSVLERNDLEELMAMATLADRDFAAEKAQVIVVSTGVVDPLQEERAAAERAAAQARNADRLRLPRRPHWDETTTPEQLDAQERSSFLTWRRTLANLEEEERLVLTPFEKNLEVWRQLWRVLERSDIVVQVVDARDPLLYRCEDLEAYARELHASKASLILLNKADLLPESVRRLWASYFDKAGLDYAFWSAAAVMEDQAALKAEASELGLDWHDLRESRQKERRLARVAAAAAAAASGAPDSHLRTEILDEDQLLALFEERAAKAVASAGPNDPRAKEQGRRYMIGLVGYPNVGKSSTINALFGAKKTAVAPTPGKTKHFQTLIVSPSLCLCDCPGLVMPKFASSRAEMVVAGVIPIDRLTEIRAPVGELATRVGRAQLETVYGLRLAPPPAHLPPSTPPTAPQLLRALALLRGWTAGSGLPDETRAGRQLLKDYTAGKLLNCTLPPDCGHPESHFIPLVHDPVTLQRLPSQRTIAPPPAGSLPPPSSTGPASTSFASTTAGASRSSGQGSSRAAAGAPQQAAGGSSGAYATTHVSSQVGVNEAALEDGQSEEGTSEGSEDGTDDESGAVGGPSSSQQQQPAAMLGDLDEADLDLLLGDLGGGSGGPGGAGAAAAAARRAAQRPQRAAHKLHKKAARTKGDRGQLRGDGVYDGAAMTTGKKGGLVRVGGYV